MQDDTDGATRTEALTGRIRRDIATNQLPAGMRLTEKGLARRYGVSRTPVREALRSLAQEALLEYAPHTGYRVTRLLLSDLDDLYAVRIAVETHAVRRLAGGVGDRETVEDLLATWSRSPQEAPPPADADGTLISADEDFHEALASAAGGSVLLETLRTINRRIHAIRMREFIDAERVSRTFEQHAGIARAILAGDPDLAVALMHAHILEGHRYVRAYALAHGLVEHAGLDLPGLREEYAP
ncbi:MAG TPA: GntR family transcriptional regulator [Egibacteraceae bacterium]|nr:GntR family transcriptional regulator [Egibacteraceae bacterium]